MIFYVQKAKTNVSLKKYFLDIESKVYIQKEKLNLMSIEIGDKQYVYKTLLFDGNTSETHVVDFVTAQCNVIELRALLS